MNSNETLKTDELYALLYQVQNRISGNLIFIYDADYSGSVFSQEVPQEGRKPILISAASAEQKLPLMEGTDFSFSGFFWKNIRNGLNLWRAFSQAKESIRFMERSVTPQLDDNGNGTANETADGNRAAGIIIGTGLGIVPNAMQFVFPETVETDAFEPDNSLIQAKVFTVDDTGQYRTLFPEGDEDWVMFYRLADQVYTISVKNQYGEPANDVKIEIFTKDNVCTAVNENGELELPKSDKDMLCYVRISSEDPGTYQYFLEIYISTAPELPVYVRGTVKDIFGNGIANALIKTDKGGSAISLPGSGNYLMLHQTGTIFFTVNAVGYIENKFYDNIRDETTVYDLDIILQPVYQPPPDTMPAAEIVSPASDNVRITEGESVRFQGNVIGGNAPFVYFWDFGSGAENVHVENPGDVFFNKAGSYTVIFSVTDADSDTGRDSVNVTVKLHPNNIPVFPGHDGNPGEDIPIWDFFSDSISAYLSEIPDPDGNPGGDVPIGREQDQTDNENIGEPEIHQENPAGAENSNNDSIADPERKPHIPSAEENPEIPGSPEPQTGQDTPGAGGDAEEMQESENRQDSVSDNPDAAKNYRTPPAPESLGESGGMGCFIRSSGWQ